MSKTWKPNRKDRRVLLALLTDAPNLSGYPLSKVAQVGSGAVYISLARLERQGWVTSDWETRSDELPRRRLYRLTGTGRKQAMAALKLEER